MMRSSVVLPASARPDQRHELALRDREIDAAQDVAVGGFGEIPGDAAQHQSGHARRQRPSRRSIGCSRKVSIAITAAMKASE